MERFADRLREARVAAGMTQEHLGFELGITKSSVSAWENGRETPSFRLLPELRRLLGRSLDELLCGAEMGRAAAAAPGATNVAPQANAPATAAVRDEKELALLVRYRNLPASKRGALLELIRPE